MANIKYSLEAVSFSAISTGMLCAVVSESTTDCIESMVKEGERWIPNPRFKGTGICKVQDTNISVVINSINYAFNFDGTSVNPNANYKLAIAKVAEDSLPQTSDSSGNAIRRRAKATTIIDEQGASTEIDYGPEGNDNIIINNLNARDEFAAKVLNQLLANVKDPASLNDSQMQYYCNAAYRWASNMMTSAADARADLNDKRESGTTVENATIDELDTNVEKLLNNIIVAINGINSGETTDITVSSMPQLAISSIPLQLINVISSIKASIDNSTIVLEEIAEAIRQLELNPTINNNIVIPEQNNTSA